MRSASEILREAGISVKHQHGSQRTTCPACSPQRRNKADKCLSVTFQTDGVTWYCHHCQDFQGGGTTMSSDLIKWLTSDRKLDDALLAHMRVQVVDHPGLGEALAFPYRRGGEPYAAKFRSLPKEWRSTQNVTRSLYNEDALRGDIDQPVVIVEGEIDCLSCIQSGFPLTVSLPDGWTEEGNKTGPILEFEEQLRKAPYLIVAGDNDKAGKACPAPWRTSSAIMTCATRNGLRAARTLTTCCA